MQISFDLIWIFLDSLKDTGQCFQQFLLGVKITIMSSRDSSIVPQPFGGIVLWRIGRQLMHFQPIPVFLEPAPNILILVVGSIILNQMDLVFSRFAAGCCYLFQEAQIHLSIKDRFTTVSEFSLLEIDGAENLDAFSGACHRNQRLEADTGPCLVESRVLPKAGFVFKEDVSPFGPRFFLMLGYL